MVRCFFLIPFLNLKYKWTFSKEVKVHNYPRSCFSCLECQLKCSGTKSLISENQDSCVVYLCEYKHGCLLKHGSIERVGKKTVRNEEKQAHVLCYYLVLFLDLIFLLQPYVQELWYLTLGVRSALY